MSSVLDPIKEAQSPSNHGNGFLALVTMIGGEFFRGAVFGCPHLDQENILKLELWESKRNGSGPIGVSAEIAVFAIKGVEIEW